MTNVHLWLFLWTSLYHYGCIWKFYVAKFFGVSPRCFFFVGKQPSSQLAYLLWKDVEPHTFLTWMLGRHCRCTAACSMCVKLPVSWNTVKNDRVLRRQNTRLTACIVSQTVTPLSQSWSLYTSIFTLFVRVRLAAGYTKDSWSQARTPLKTPAVAKKCRCSCHHCRKRHWLQNATFMYTWWMRTQHRHGTWVLFVVHFRWKDRRSTRRIFAVNCECLCSIWCACSKCFRTIMLYSRYVFHKFFDRHCSRESCCAWQALFQLHIFKLDFPLSVFFPFVFVSFFLSTLPVLRIFVWCQIRGRPCEFPVCFDAYKELNILP